MRRSLSFVGALSATAIFAVPAQATETIETEGIAAIVNNDIGMARDKALDDAKRKAVEQVAGAHVSAETITENFQLVADRIYSRASGYVKSFEIKAQFKDEDTYHVKIRAQVDKSAVAEHLDQIFAIKPRVLVMIAEQNVGAGNYAYWWGRKGFTSEMDIMQSSLISAWQPRGFKFVDPGLMKGKLRIKRGMKRAEIANNDAISIGKNADADIAIVGKVAVTDAGPVMDGVKMRSFHAVGSLRVLNISTGEIVTVADDSAVAPHIDGNQGGRNAIKALAAKLGGNLEKAILKKWTAESVGARDVSLVLSGRVKKKQLKAIKLFLTGEVRGVEGVQIRRRTKSKTHLVVRFKGTGLDLGNFFDDKEFEGFGAEVANASKDKLVIEVAKN